MIRINMAGADQAIALNRAESRFLVESELILNLSGGRLGYEVVAVAPYEKVYSPSEPEGESTTPSVSFLAHSGSRVVGRIALNRHWNQFAYVNHLVVEPIFRRSGVGRALVQQAIEWSQAERLAGVMLETQNNNVAACKLYERCGCAVSMKTCTVAGTLTRQRLPCSGTGYCSPDPRRDAQAKPR